MDNGDNTSPKLSTLTNKNGQIKFLKFCLDYEEYDIPLTDFIILLPSAVLLFTYSLQFPFWSSSLTITIYAVNKAMIEMMQGYPLNIYLTSMLFCVELNRKSDLVQNIDKLSWRRQVISSQILTWCCSRMGPV